MQCAYVQWFAGRSVYVALQCIKVLVGRHQSSTHHASCGVLMMHLRWMPATASNDFTSPYSCVLKWWTYWTELWLTWAKWCEISDSGPIVFWPTVLSVELLVHCVVCRHLSVVCDILYCGETVCPSKKVSEWVNRKPGSKSSFFGSPIFLLPVSPLRPPRWPFLPFFCLYSPAIGTRWYKWSF